ncbi:mitochondrial inner membrane protease subunit 1 [Drosophila subobscura]|uniref:mitochondrial inner membrane protease subunit 1 n=1 Tax=Drosophila subobscura TaxID=7241 RepID=UPI00155A98C8|nr:mitochondrial inner membrane protease subunit 1 [Drosophila subobscura]
MIINWKRLSTIVRYSVAYAAITHCTFEYIGDFVLCKGPSMEPTLYTDNVLVTERLTKYWRGYKPGDIVIAVSPTNARQCVCKRVVAVSGEEVFIAKPQPLEAECSPSAKKKQPVMIKSYVPRGHIWIEGDNKDNSCDSRYYGPIPVGLIRSRVVYRVWPLADACGEL